MVRVHVAEPILIHNGGNLMSEKEYIKIEYPFNELYDSGYKTNNEDGRIFIRLRPINTTIYSKRLSYSRYVMGIHLKRILKDNEKVYHRDKNLLNFDINNLKVVTIATEKQNTISNKMKQPNVVLTLEQRKFTAICSQCNKEYTRVTKITTDHNFCSTTCQHKFFQKTKQFFNKTFKVNRLI